MPATKKQPSPAHGPTETELLERALANVKTFVRNHGAHLVLGIAIAFLCVTIVRYVANSREAAQINAWQTMAEDGTVAALTGLRDQDPAKGFHKTEKMIASCKTIIENTSGGPARWAQLRLATLYAAKRDWDNALANLETLIEGSRESPAAVAAAPTHAAVLEQMGRYGDAAKAYRGLASTSAQKDDAEIGTRTYLLAAGRCYEIGHEYDSATALYEELIDVGPAPLAQRAEARLRAIKGGKAYTEPPALQAMPLVFPTDDGDETPGFDMPDDSPPTPTPDSPVEPDTDTNPQ